jgi:hypothetical protein
MGPKGGLVTGTRGIRRISTRGGDTSGRHGLVRSTGLGGYAFTGFLV